jgi:hypothetical protein
MAAMVGRDLGQHDGAAPKGAHQQQEPDRRQALDADLLPLAVADSGCHGVPLSHPFPLSSIDAAP